VFHLDVSKVDMGDHILSTATTLLGVPPWVTLRVSEASRRVFLSEAGDWDPRGAWRWARGTGWAAGARDGHGCGMHAGALMLDRMRTWIVGYCAG
jgi:hypothetical protein